MTDHERKMLQIVAHRLHIDEHALPMQTLARRHLYGMIFDGMSPAIVERELVKLHDLPPILRKKFGIELV